MLGQTKLVHHADFGADDAKDEINSEPLADDACAITADRIRVSKISIASFVQFGFVLVRKKPFGKR